MFFEWDSKKNDENIKKHNISFDLAKEVFYDKNNLIALDKKHSNGEKRYFCIGKISNEGIVTVRWTYRKTKIRIIGAGYWRKGKEIYEKENKL